MLEEHSKSTFELIPCPVRWNCCVGLRKSHLTLRRDDLTSSFDGNDANVCSSARSRISLKSLHQGG